MPSLALSPGYLAAPSGSLTCAGAEAAAALQPAPTVAVRQLTKRYGSTTAIEEVSFEVRRGSFVTLLGPSGSGKTTILRTIAGFERPTAGEIRINGHAVDATPPYRRSIGVVFQSLALFPHLTVAENVAYPLRCRRFDRRLIPGLVTEYLALVRLAGFEHRRLDQLSGGQRQRVAIARALIYKPDLLLLDEPLAALDKTLREEIQLELRRIQRELGVTTINVTHDQREALVMSDEIILLDNGRIQQIGSPEAVYRRPLNRFAASFVGHCNVLSGRVRAASETAVTVELGDGPAFVMPLGDRAVPPAGSIAEWAIRAERIVLRPAETPAHGFEPRLRGTVSSAAYEGDRVLYEVMLAGSDGPVLRVIENDPAEAFRPGDMVSLGWTSEDAVLLDHRSCH